VHLPGRKHLLYGQDPGALTSGSYSYIFGNVGTLENNIMTSKTDDSSDTFCRKEKWYARNVFCMSVKLGHSAGSG
jgi:hypothetical protein